MSERKGWELEESGSEEGERKEREKEERWHED